MSAYRPYELAGELYVSLKCGGITIFGDKRHCCHDPFQHLIDAIERSPHNRYLPGQAIGNRFVAPAYFLDDDLRVFNPWIALQSQGHLGVNGEADRGRRPLYFGVEASRQAPDVTERLQLLAIIYSLRIFPI